jgi:hypothetical protein
MRLSQNAGFVAGLVPPTWHGGRKIWKIGAMGKTRRTDGGAGTPQATRSGAAGRFDGKGPSQAAAVIRLFC